MSGQQSIIDRIILEAQQKSEIILDKAKKEAGAIIDAAYKDNIKLGEVYLEKAKKEAESIIAGKNRECDLEIRKKILTCRFAAIDQAFSRARQRLLSFDDLEYIEYIKKHIKLYANHGDKIIISSDDEHRITQNVIDNISKEMGIELQLAEERGFFKGGIIIKSKYWDYNLTIESNFKVFRDEYEAAVSEML